LNKIKLNSQKIFTRNITALWALSEVAFGGLLHALKIPFTGLFIGGTAIIFITLIFFYSENKAEIIKATFIVVIIKAMISPHVPIFAHFAVLIQGFLGYLILSRKRLKLTAYIIAVISMLFSAFQMIFTLTIIFGETFWNSINLFGKHVMSLFDINSIFLEHYLYVLIIGIYIYLHILGGLIAGYIAGKIPEWIADNVKDISLPPITNQNPDDETHIKSKKHFLQKPIKIFFLLFLIILLVITYSDRYYFNNILMMLIRAILILIIWYFFLSPYASRLFNKFLKKQKNKNSEEVKKILEFLPEMKIIVQHSWKYSKEQKGLKKLKQFILNISYYLMIEQ
jgi:hypothetical protein